MPLESILPIVSRGSNGAKIADRGVGENVSLVPRDTFERSSSSSGLAGGRAPSGAQHNTGFVEWLSGRIGDIGRFLEERALGEKMERTAAKFASREDLKSFYSCKSTEPAVRAAALHKTRPMYLTEFMEDFKISLDTEATHPAIVRAIRCFLDKILGPCASPEEARRQCRALYLTQHPDRVGVIDCGDPVANKWAANLYELLNLSKRAINSSELADRLYPSTAPTLDRFTRTTGFFLSCSVQVRQLLASLAAAIRTCCSATMTWLNGLVSLARQ